MILLRNDLPEVPTFMVVNAGTKGHSLATTFVRRGETAKPIRGKRRCW
jgi:hypothetical protein